MSTTAASNTIPLKHQFIGEQHLRLDHGLFPCEEFSEASSDEDLSVNEKSVYDERVVKKVYRASLLLTDFLANVLIALVIQMNITTNNATGSSKITTQIVECDNNGIKRVFPGLDKGVPCMCTNRASPSCSAYDVCKRRCPRAVHRRSDGLPLLIESNEEQILDKNESVMRKIYKIREERRANTRQIYLWYQHLLTKKFTPFVCSLIKDKKLSLSRLKCWIIFMSPKLRSINNEQDLESLLGSFYPPWYDTRRLSKLIEKLKPLDIDQEIVQSLSEFNAGVDDYFSKRVFIKGAGVNGEPIVIISVDPEWHDYPAHDMHLLRGRAVKALKQVRNCTFTILFCTVLKEYVIKTNIKKAVSGFKKTVVEDLERHQDEALASSGFPSLEEVGFNSATSALVIGREANNPVNEGHACDLFKLEGESEQGGLAECCRPFTCCYGQ